MRNLKTIVFEGPEFNDFRPLIPWAVLLLVLGILQIGILWLMILGAYVLGRALLWAVKSDREERVTRELNAAMGDSVRIEEADEDAKLEILERFHDGIDDALDIILRRK